MTRTGIIELLTALPDRPSRVVFAQQEHGAEITDADAAGSLEKRPGNWWEALACDGLFTQQAGTALVVRTADCCPVVIASDQTPWVAALHAGWRGTLAGITRRAIGLALSHGVPASSLHLWVGPSISGEVYEVSEDLADRFESEHGGIAAIRKGRLVNLVRANHLQATEAGVPPENLHASAYCTFQRSDLFPSYRRDGRCEGQIHTCALLGMRD